YSWVKDHEESIADVSFIPFFEEVHVDYEPGTVRDVELHDGSHILLKKLGEDHDPTDRRAAMTVLEEGRTTGHLVTGLLYLGTATAIHGRFLKLFAGGLSPAAVLALEDGAMRSAGVSGAKAAAINDLAAKVGDGTVPLGDVESLSDDELVARLVQVRGIGRWTAEMFLLFQLRRLDVWPVDDFGVRKGWTLTHRKREMITPRALQAEGEKFRPYRSVAAWYCWRAVENIVLPT